MLQWLVQIAEFTGVKPYLIVLLDVGTIGLVLHTSPFIEDFTYWIEFGLKCGMMIAATWLHVYSLRKARKENNKPPTP